LQNSRGVTHRGEPGSIRMGYEAQTGPLAVTMEVKRELGEFKKDLAFFKGDVTTKFFEMQKDISELKKGEHSLGYAEDISLSSRFQQTISHLTSTVAGIQEALEKEEDVRAARDETEANLRETGLRSLEERLESEEASLKELCLQVKGQLSKEPPCEATTRTEPNFNGNHKRPPRSLPDDKDQAIGQMRADPLKQIRAPGGKKSQHSNTLYEADFHSVSEVSDVLPQKEREKTPSLSPIHPETSQVRPAHGTARTSNFQHSQVRATPMQSPTRLYLQRPDPPPCQSPTWGSDKSMLNGTANNHNVLSSLPDKTSGSGSFPSGGQYGVRMSASMNLPTQPSNPWVDWASGGSINMNALSATNDKIVRGTPDPPGVRTSPQWRHSGARTVDGHVPPRTTSTNVSTGGCSPIPESNHRRAKQSNRLKEW